MQSTLPKPDKTRCAQCGEHEPPSQTLRRCSKCRTVPYSSVACQKLAWKEHKRVCVVYAMDSSMNDAGVYMGEKPPKVKKGEIRRTRGHILNDLMRCAQSHNGDTFTISAWNLLELAKDITRAQTHFLAVTLRRTASSDPRLLYSLVDAEVLPWAELEAAYANRANFSDLSPAMFARDEERRKREDGALGSVMVVSIELPKGDERKPRNALTESLGLFKEHQARVACMTALPKTYFMQCLKNSLEGGAYSVVFVPYTPPEDS